MAVRSRLFVDGEKERAIEDYARENGAVRFVGTGGRLRADVLATSPTHTVMEVEHFMYVGNDTPWVSFLAQNWYTTSTGGLGLPPTALTIEGSSVVNASRTRRQPIRWGGARNYDIPSGYDMWSDRVHALDFNLPIFKRGQKLICRARLAVPANTGQFPCRATQFNPPGTYASRFDPAEGTNATSQVDLLTPMTAKTGQADFAVGWMFTQMAGQPLDPRIPVLICADGDSIGQSSNDTDGYILESGSGLCRLGFDANQGRPIPMINMARGSSSVAGSALSLTNRAALFPFCAGGVAISQGGTGDIGISGGGDIEALKVALLANWSALRAAGVARIIRLGILPRPADTTGAAQPNFDTKSLAMHEWFQRQLLAGVIDAYVPLYSLRDPNDFTKWKPGLMPGASAPADYTHPPSAGHILIHAEVRAVLESWYPQILAA